MARVIGLGRAAFGPTWELQRRLVEEVAAGGENVVIVVEHEPVYTLGRRRGAAANVVAPGDTPVVEVERGGDVTWHGPGQLVCYPILRLDPIDLHGHLHRLEALMFGVCAAFGLRAGRDPRNTGAWIAGRKVGSVGIACRRGVTWHGLALNVDVDFAAFGRIHPCGFPATIMTSMARELGRPLPLGVVAAELRARVADW